MMTRVEKLSIAGLGITLELNGPAQIERLVERYRGFVSEHTPLMTAQVHWQKSTECESNQFPEVEFSEKAWEFRSPFYEGKIDLQRQNASLAFISSHPFEGVDYFLRLIYALLAYENGGLLFHAAGVVRNGRAYVFIGHSGVGKTTVSRLSGEQNVLNDDLVTLMPQSDGWKVHATPFWNPTQVRPRPSSAPLHAIYQLVQDRKVFLDEISPSLGLAEFLASIPVISLDPFRCQKLLLRAQMLLETYPVRNLHFLPDDSFWDIIG